MSRPATLAGWGAGRQVAAEIARPGSLEALRGVLSNGVRGVIGRGMGRAYGDAAQLGGGLVIEMGQMRGFDLDPAAGVVTAEAGVTLGELLAALEPAGWVLPVVPGTQHVSIGGAIAADIHGKNHGSAGTFGSHVEALGLLNAGGELEELTPGAPGGLFEATLGGMGLTGLIIWARVRLTALRSATLSVTTNRVRRLEDALAVLAAPGGVHRVAWLDLLGPVPVRGVVTRAEQLAADPGGPGGGPAPGRVLAAGKPPSTARSRCTVPARLTVPRPWPGGLLRPGVVRAYNEYRYRRTPPRQVERLEPFGAHMFPLDALSAWPRLYGSTGLVQYQLAVPRGAEDALEAVLGRLRRSAVPCYLAVLKDFGPANDAPLSFPIEGWTLALDMPRAAPGLERLLSEFDALVAGAGGRVYLAKDSHLEPGTLAAMYPRLDEWRAVRDAADPDGMWRSDLGLRTGLIGAAR